MSGLYDDENNEECIELASERDYSEAPAHKSKMTPKERKKLERRQRRETKRLDEENKSGFRVFLEYLRVIAIGVLVAFLLCRFVIINAEVPSSSMVPTIRVKDRMIGLRLTYYFSDPQRGDVAIFKCPEIGDDYGKLYVKRVIGLPGETVTISAGKVIITTVDGETIYLDEPYLNEEPWPDVGVNNSSITLGDDEYFMMGDNRNYSHDSRYFGPVRRDRIKAKVLFKYYKGFKVIK